MLRGFLTHERYHDADDGQPQGGGAGDAGGKIKPSDILAQYGQTAEAALRMAERLADIQNDNWAYRRKIERLTVERADLEKRLAPEGARVLTPDEATAYDAYVALGKPDALKTALDSAQTATAELGTLRRQERIRAAAEAAGFKPSVLTTLAGDLDIQIKAGSDGKASAVVVADGKETPLAEYAKTAWQDFLPALTPQSQQAPDINAAARGNGNAPLITQEERDRAAARYRLSF